MARRLQILGIYWVAASETPPTAAASAPQIVRSGRHTDKATVVLIVDRVEQRSQLLARGARLLAKVDDVDRDRVLLEHLAERGQLGGRRVDLRRRERRNIKRAERAKKKKEGERERQIYRETQRERHIDR